MTDTEILETLNSAYIDSVQNGDVGRFNEILADDFYCSNPDGTLIDRAAFLVQTARPVSIRDLRAHDVLIRLFGDVAVIHGRTTYTLADGRDQEPGVTPMSGPGRGPLGERYQPTSLAVDR